MLEKVEFIKDIEKESIKKEWEELGEKLLVLQRDCKSAQIPVMIVFEGIGAGGKGMQINKLLRYLDPRGFKVHAMKKAEKEKDGHPFLWKYWCRTPEYGRIAIFDTSWYGKVLKDSYEEVKESKLEAVYEDIQSFEKQLTDDGMVIIKLYLHISKKEQKKRYEGLLEHKSTAWRVSKEDLKKNKNYEEFLALNDEMLEKTNYEYAPWTVIDATNKNYAALMIMKEVVGRLEAALAKKQAVKKEKPSPMAAKENYVPTVLSQADLTKTMDAAEYQERLEALQERLALLHSEIYRRKIPVVLAFEGWDAAGKGGAIKRLTSALDPRGYAVYPTSSPNDIEKSHHYLWRFWNNMPKAGHISIFDRTWYGRVMVERVEGFCSEEEWKREYDEMNEMESNLYHAGAVVLKFWLQIDKDEQEKRFNERTNNPAKQWKITDEDWRNRAKWDAYEECVDEMIIKTSTEYAPWVVVEANSKYYARIKVLMSVIEAIEKRLKE